MENIKINFKDTSFKKLFSIMQKIRLKIFTIKLNVLKTLSIKELKEKEDKSNNNLNKIDTKYNGYKENRYYYWWRSWYEKKSIIIQR